jgi:hypothetical protein
MRFTIPETPRVRIVTRFLLFPRKIGDEMRWLEWAQIEQHRNAIEGFWYDVAFSNLKITK